MVPVPVPPAEPTALAPAEPLALTAEARLAQNISLGFRRIFASPQLARPLYLAKTYWPVAVIPTTVGIVAAVGVKTSLTVVGTALLWGMSIAIQLWGNM